MSAPHELPSDGLLPGVELGIVLAFPCPACGAWTRPTRCASCFNLVTTCGCRRHLWQDEINAVYAVTARLVRHPSAS